MAKHYTTPNLQVTLLNRPWTVQQSSHYARVSNTIRLTCLLDRHTRGVFICKSGEEVDVYLGEETHVRGPSRPKTGGHPSR